MDASKTKVLIVDDNPAQLRLLAVMLGKDGYIVSQAQDGQEALAAIEKDSPHFLITDWDMPHMDGIELCRRVRDMDLENYVYIVFATGRTSAEDVIRGLEAGADDYLTTPIKRSELAARLGAGSRVVELEHRLSRLANSDPLTSLPTKRTFLEHLTKEWQRSERHKIPISCVMLDIDFFKRINDTYGHPTGDTVIKAIARVLQESCRISDFPCRYGGEEFCILLPETNEQQAALWANRVRKKIESLGFSFEGTEHQISASLGVAERQDDMSDADELIERADRSLHVAKNTGRNRVVGFSAVVASAASDTAGAQGENDPFYKVLARHVMTPAVSSLRDNDPLELAARWMVEHRTGSIPIVNDEQKLVGILSQKDLVAAIRSADRWDQRIRDIMTTNVATYDEETPIEHIYDFLCRAAIRQIVIVKNEQPVGLIGCNTLVRWFDQWLVASTSDHLSDKEKISSNLRRFAAGIHDISEHVVGQAISFEQQFAHVPNGEPLQQMVGSASQLQELANDLLACSSLLNQASGAKMPSAV